MDAVIAVLTCVHGRRYAAEGTHIRAGCMIDNAAVVKSAKRWDTPAVCLAIER